MQAYLLKNKISSINTKSSSFDINNEPIEQAMDIRMINGDNYSIIGDPAYVFNEEQQIKNAILDSLEYILIEGYSFSSKK